LFPQALLAHISTHVTLALPASLPLFVRAKTTPHLGYIGDPPPHRESISMSDIEQTAGTAVRTGAGEEITNVDLEKEEVLPVLSSIWECPMIKKVARFDNNGKSYAGWTCGWCPSGDDGSVPKPFWSMNAAKVLVHVAKLTGFDIRPCPGRIPAAKSRQYRDLHLSKTLTKEQRRSKKYTMANSIADMQIRLYYHWLKELT